MPNCTYPAGKGPDTVPGPRAAHSCNVIGSKLYLFGGWNGQAGLNDLYVLDTSSAPARWEVPLAVGSPPTTRNNHATFVYQGKLYIHGGHDHSIGWLSDMHVLDTNPTSSVKSLPAPTTSSPHLSAARHPGPATQALGQGQGSPWQGHGQVRHTGGSGAQPDALDGSGEGGSGSTRHAEVAMPGLEGMEGGSGASTGGLQGGGLGIDGSASAAWASSGSTGGAGGGYSDSSLLLSSNRGRAGSGSFTSLPAAAPPAWPLHSNNAAGDTYALHGSNSSAPDFASPARTLPAGVVATGGGGGMSAATVPAAPYPLAWSRPQLGGSPPCSRACHTLTLVGKRVYCLGGYDGRRCFCELDVLDLETATWIQPRTYGSAPKPRNAQTVTAIGAKLYLFGGHSGTTHLRDLHVFDTSTLTWSQPEAGGTPPPGLRGHTATLVGGSKILLFGGFDGRGRSNDLYILDTSTCTWESPPPLLSAGLPGGESSGTGGSGAGTVLASAPSGRQRHTACLVNNRHLFIIGGFNGSEWLQDVHVLDVSRILVPRAARGLEGVAEGGLGDSPLTTSWPGIAGALATWAGLVNNPDAFPDVCFLVEGRPMYAHRAILAARCEHYAAMFSGAFREGRGSGRSVDAAASALSPPRTLQGEQAAGAGMSSASRLPLPLDTPIAVPDWSHAAFLTMLEWLYTGSTVHELSPEVALDVLGLSDALCLHGLRKLAESVLQHALDATSVCTILAAAHRHGAVELKSMCVEYLISTVQEDGDVDLSPLEGVEGLLVDITKTLLKAQRARG